MEQSLIVGIVQAEDAGLLVDRLVEQGFGVTRIDTFGGFLQRGNVAVVVGTARDTVPTLLRIVEQSCRTRTAFYCPPIDDLAIIPQPIEVEVGGAIVFELPVERQVKLVGRLRPNSAAAETERAS